MGQHVTRTLIFIPAHALNFTVGQIVKHVNWNSYLKFNHTEQPI
jgi:hypothetical protein